MATSLEGIRNLSASTDGTGTGGVLFGTLENATVQNLCIVGGTITATVNNGGTLASVTDMLIKKEENFSKEKKYDIRQSQLERKLGKMACILECGLPGQTRNSIVLSFRFKLSTIKYTFLYIA